MITALLPQGAMGLVLVGLIAAIMSSIDSTLNSASTMVTLDFIAPRRRNMSPAMIALVGRVVIIIFMVFAALWAPQIARFEGLFNYLQAALSYIVPPVVVLFLVGMFWRRATAHAAFYTLIGGHVLSLGVFVGQRAGVFPPIHFTIVAGMLLFVCAALFIALSLVTRPAAESEVLARSAPPAAGAAAWTDHRILSVVLLLLTAALVVGFW